MRRSTSGVCGAALPACDAVRDKRSEGPTRGGQRRSKWIHWKREVSGRGVRARDAYEPKGYEPPEGEGQRCVENSPAQGTKCKVIGMEA